MDKSTIVIDLIELAIRFYLQYCQRSAKCWPGLRPISLTDWVASAAAEESLERDQVSILRERFQNHL